MSVQFLKLNAFSTCSRRFLISNINWSNDNLNWQKLLGFRSKQEKLENKTYKVIEVKYNLPVLVPRV